MSILTSYTLRCLKKNRVRTLVTVVGIILSVALFTAVAEGAWSGRQYLVDVAEASVGAYHAMYDELSDAELAELKAQSEVKELATLDSVGWALAGDPSHVFPYLRISSMGEGFQELVTVRLLEGRLPENDHELLISDRANPSTGTQLRVGQSLRLSVGQRATLDGQRLGEHDSYQFEEEQLVDTVEGEYTVVGVYDRFSSTIESYEMPGTLVLTVGAPASGTDHKAFFTLDRIGRVYDFLSAHGYGSGRSDNKDLLLYSGVSQNNLLVRVIYGLATILFGLIFLGSVSLIYNSFSISVSERTKQFGLLKSIGATNRQVRRTVLMEALLLCVAAIPLGLIVGCGGIGLTLRFLRPAFDSFVLLDGAQNVSIKLALHAPSLLLAAGIGLFTALVSAWIPAKRATRLSPIAAIRQSADVKVRAKEVKVSGLTGRLFGFPGTLAAKNFKRSRKQYRSTVISLFLSIVLFISAFSLADILRRDVAETVSGAPADITGVLIDDEADSAAIYENLKTVEGVEDSAWAVSVGAQALLDRSVLSEKALLACGEGEGSAAWDLTVCFLPEEQYAALCAEAGVDPAAGDALLYGRYRARYQNESGVAFEMIDLLREGVLPLETELSWQRKQIPGYYFYDSVQDEDWNIVALIYASDETKADGSPADFKELSVEEATGKTAVKLAAQLKERPLASGDGCALYLPMSQLEPVFGGEAYTEHYYFFKAANHSQTATNLRSAMDDMGLDHTVEFYDAREGEESTQAFLLVLNVFTFGFIILISLIAAANVFNTISTNVALRRREFATLKSVGMGDKAFGRMMRFECLLYGSKALLLGLPVSIGISWLIWKAVSNAFLAPYRLPWTAMAIAAGSVFLVVFATMLYATGKIRRDNPIDALKQETL